MPILEEKGKHEASWITISTDEYESMQATIEVLSDPQILEQLQKSDADIRDGKVKPWNQFLKEIKKKK